MLMLALSADVPLNRLVLVCFDSTAKDVCVEANVYKDFVLFCLFAKEHPPSSIADNRDELLEAGGLTGLIYPCLP